MDAFRQTLATAVDALADFNCTPTHRPLLKPGDAFVRRAHRMPDPAVRQGYGWIDTWEVWAMVPQDHATGEAWLDDRIQLVLDAIRPLGDVSGVLPAPLAVTSAASPINGVIFTLLREA